MLSWIKKRKFRISMLLNIVVLSVLVMAWVGAKGSLPSVHGTYLCDEAILGEGLHLAIEDTSLTYTKYRQFGEYEHGFWMYMGDYVYMLESKDGVNTRVLIRKNDEVLYLISDNLEVIALRRISDTAMYMGVYPPDYPWNGNGY